MADPVLHDAVTLRHFASCGKLNICELLHSALPTPRWTEAVHGELQRGARNGNTDCSTVLGQHWLGAPIIPSTTEQSAIYRLRVALNGGTYPPSADAGEAESIFFAQQLGGLFATDDNAAHAFASRRLGPRRVIDSVDILRLAVRAGHVTAADAVTSAMAIRAAGRSLRRVHPITLTDSYFK